MIKIVAIKAAQFKYILNKHINNSNITKYNINRLSTITLEAIGFRLKIEITMKKNHMPADMFVF